MEIDEGVAYLRALKQSAGPVAETATAPARDSNPEATYISPATAADSGDGFKGAEKRRSPRYKCEGSAEMCEAGHDVRTWATATSGWDCLRGDVGREPVSTARTAGHHHPADCDHGSGNRFLSSRRRATERPTHNHKSQAALKALAEFFESRQMLMREDFLPILRQGQTTEPRMKIQTSES